MIKVILFDCDGPIIKRDKYFSQRLGDETGVIIDTQNESSFFKGEFLECEIGKKDLKEVLPKWLATWQWKGTADELMDYWFSGEATIDPLMKSFIESVRSNAVKSYLATNNEKYRTEYLWNHVGLKNFLDGLFSSCYLGYMKPDIKYWETLYKNLKDVEKSEIVLWDDKQAAINSAKEFGFNAEHYKDFADFYSVMKEKYKIIT